MLLCYLPPERKKKKRKKIIWVKILAVVVQDTLIPLYDPQVLFPNVQCTYE